MNFKWLSHHRYMLLILLVLCLPHNMSAIITPIKSPHIQDQEVALLIKQKAIEKQKQIDAQKKKKREQIITATILVLAAVGITGWITYWLKSQFSKNNQKSKAKTEEQKQNLPPQPSLNDECVCAETLTTLDAAQIFSMPCKHAMCKTCADGWFFINNSRPNSTCPYCRQNVPLSLCAEQLKDYPKAKAYEQTQARLNQRQHSPQHFAPAQFGLRNINDDRLLRLMMANFNLQFV